MGHYGASTKTQIPVLEGPPKPYFGLLGSNLPPLAIYQTHSSPLRIQVIPNAMITNQCHRDHSSRSILAGTKLSTAFAAAPPLSTPRLLSLAGRGLRSRAPGPPNVQAGGCTLLRSYHSALKG